MTTSVLVAGQPDGTEELALASGAPPHVLVPGSAEELDRAASTLDAYAAVLRDTATSLSRIEITGWRGAARAGHDAADDAQPGRWTAAAAALVTAAGALRKYVAHLAPAREVAAEAVRLYEQYTAVEGSLEILTTAVDIQPPDGSSMLVGYRSARLRDADQVGSGGDEGVAPAGGALLGATATTVIPALAHDADAVRRQAIATLVRARGIVRSAGAVATDTLRRAEADAPQARRLWEGTIRPSAAEGAAHHVLDVVSLAPGPVGIGAAGTNAAWYAASPYGSSDQAAYAVAGAIPLGKLAKGTLVVNEGVEAASAAKALATGPISHVSAVIDPKKFDYFFGRVASGTHNRARSTQILLQLDRIGIRDDDLGQRILLAHLRETASSVTNVARRFSNEWGDFEVRESLLAGPYGFVHVESCWQVHGGTRTLTTFIPRGRS